MEDERLCCMREREADRRREGTDSFQLACNYCNFSGNALRCQSKDITDPLKLSVARLMSNVLARGGSIKAKGSGQTPELPQTRPCIRAEDPCQQSDLIPLSDCLLWRDTSNPAQRARNRP